jgi:hypothetical protein
MVMAARWAADSKNALPVRESASPHVDEDESMIPVRRTALKRDDFKLDHGINSVIASQRVARMRAR